MMLNQMVAGQWTREEAAQILGLSARQVRRRLDAAGTPAPARAGPRSIANAGSACPKPGCCCKPMAAATIGWKAADRS